MVALPFTNGIIFTPIGILAVSARPAIPALADPENSGIVQKGADRSVDAAWSLTIYSEPNSPSDAVTFKGTSSSPTDCKDFGGSSLSFGNLCDPAAQVGFELQTFRLGDCAGIEKKFSSSTEATDGSFRSWRVVERNTC